MRLEPLCIGLEEAEELDSYVTAICQFSEKSVEYNLDKAPYQT
jgi:hypothetical protein